MEKSFTFHFLDEQNGILSLQIINPGVQIWLRKYELVILC